MLWQGLFRARSALFCRLYELVHQVAVREPEHSVKFELEKPSLVVTERNELPKGE